MFVKAFTFVSEFRTGLLASTVLHQNSIGAGKMESFGLGV